MSADVIDLVEMLDEHAERAADKLCSEPELDPDGGQAIYNALPRELQRTCTHLAFLMRDADRWPSAALITSIAEYHQADVGAALCLVGWMPRRELTDVEARCLELSKQLALGLSFELEVGGPADIVSQVWRG